MAKLPAPPKGVSALARTWRRLRGRADVGALEHLPCIPVPAEGVRTLAGPAVFRETLHALIAQARERILISALYVQDDEAGREVLAALHAAKVARPSLEVAVFVDWHRARRGLIGHAKSAGNAAMYRETTQRLGPGVPVYGVPVQTRELMGVLHLKGFVIDDAVLYSGASLNDVYLNRHGRYRLDRYHLLADRQLADSLAGLLQNVIRPQAAVHPLDIDDVPRIVTLGQAIADFRRELARSRYQFAEGAIRGGEVGVTPIVGLGLRGNALNAAILAVIAAARERLVIYTPYFNLPWSVRRAIDARLKAGCRVILVAGDKVANDFFIPPEEPFKAIGTLPYLYEANLRRYCRARQSWIDRGRLDVHLWRDGDNTFHLKGLQADDAFALLTGHNVNPRAWRLDLENGLLIRDPKALLAAQHREELDRVLARTRRVGSWRELEQIEDYPAKVQRMLKRLARSRLDRIVGQVL